MAHKVVNFLVAYLFIKIESFLKDVDALIHTTILRIYRQHFSEIEFLVPKFTSHITVRYRQNNYV